MKLSITEKVGDTEIKWEFDGHNDDLIECVKSLYFKEDLLDIKISPVSAIAANFYADWIAKEKRPGGLLSK